MERKNFKEKASEFALVCIGGAVAGAFLGGGAYVGWAFVRGVIRLIGE